MRRYILADDLSGLLDAAAAFSGMGAEIRVVLGPDNIRVAREHELLALTTETRNASPFAAAEQVHRVLRAAEAGRRTLLFKKIDSTLRGPIAAEFAALTEVLPDTRFLFAPANPAMGRTVRDGVLLVKGIPVAETEYGRDPVSPVRSSVVRDVLAVSATDQVVIPDADTQHDLEAAVDAMNAADRPWVGVGSGALARAIMARSVGHASLHRAPYVFPDAVSGTLMVCGSAHALNRAQAAALRAARGVPTREIDVAAQPHRLRGLAANLTTGGAASILIQQTRTESGAACAAIVAAAAEIIERAAVRRVFVTGGETAFALCRALGVASLRFVAEIEPGVSLSLADSSRGSLLLAIKPGGFGDAETWIRVWDRLRDS